MGRAGAHELFGLSLAGAEATWGDVQRWRRRRRGPLTTNFAGRAASSRATPAGALTLQLHFVVSSWWTTGAPRCAAAAHHAACACARKAAAVCAWPAQTRWPRP
ncbi:MAG: hypothetical protein R3E52_00665 [Burkholderiaceae bacterium]